MSTINDSGPAFPSNRDMRHNPDWDHEPGMSLRDYMAIHASAEDVRDQGEVLRLKLGQQGFPGILPDGWRVTARYMHADAMLKAREEGGAA